MNNSIPDGVPANYEGEGGGCAIVLGATGDGMITLKLGDSPTIAMPPLSAIAIGTRLIDHTVKVIATGMGAPDADHPGEGRSDGGIIL